MSDPNTDQNPYEDGAVPADADLNDDPTGEEVLDAMPGASRLGEGADNPGESIDESDVRPDGQAPLP